MFHNNYFVLSENFVLKIVFTWQLEFYRKLFFLYNKKTLLVEYFFHKVPQSFSRNFAKNFLLLETLRVQIFL